MPKSKKQKQPNGSDPRLDRFRIADIRRIIEGRRAAGLAGAALLAEEERCFRAALPHLLTRGGLSRPAAWAEARCPALFNEKGLSWIEGLAEEYVLAGRFRSADKLAKDLGLTFEERERLKVTTIGACDLTKEEREAARRQKAALRAKQWRAKKREEAGKSAPREPTAAERAKAEGISRSTLYRRRRKAETLERTQQYGTPSNPGAYASVSPHEWRSGDPLRGAPASRSDLSTSDNFGSLPLPALSAMDLLRAHSFIEFTR